ncbi:MAG TPA: DUF3617 domain-containing protein [Rugosibacter sp.]
MRKLSLLLLAYIGFAATAHAEAMKPGLWEVTSQMSGGNMPKMPTLSAAELKQMEAMGIKLPNAGNPMMVTVKQCVTKEQAEKRLPPQGAEDHRQRCEQKDMKTSGNTMTWKIECNGEQKMSGTGSMTWQNSEHYTGRSTFTMQDPQRGQMTMSQTYTAKWLAANCK